MLTAQATADDKDERGSAGARGQWRARRLEAAEAWTKQQRRLRGVPTCGGATEGGAAAASAGLRRRDIDSGGVNGVEQLRGGALSDRSFIDEGCDSTRFDDARDSNEDSLCVLYNWLLDMTKKRLVDCVLTNTDEDLQSFDHDETQPPSEDQRNDNETQDEVENYLYDDVEVSAPTITAFCARSPLSPLTAHRSPISAPTPLSLRSPLFALSLLTDRSTALGPLLDVLLTAPITALYSIASISRSLSPSLTALSTVISLPSLKFRSSLRSGLLAALPSPRPKLFAVAAIGASVSSAVAVYQRLECPKPLPITFYPLKYLEWKFWKAKLQRRRQELTQTTPDQPMDDEAVYYKVAGDYPKGCVYSLRSLWRKKRRYVDPDASTSQRRIRDGMQNSVSIPSLISNGSEMELLYSLSDPSLISNGSETELLYSVSDPSLISNGSETEYNNSVSDPLLIHASIPRKLETE
ncbi:hypothetical protein Syun_031698 [Stephania yunnanensis]|uniref:Uncharacterized protein n=1 Tax=Stephania yunnanensis TaxID=152371 RepID=A0AAP0HGP9_9MAGN